MKGLFGLYKSIKRNILVADKFRILWVMGFFLIFSIIFSVLSKGNYDLDSAGDQFQQKFIKNEILLADCLLNLEQVINESNSLNGDNIVDPFIDLPSFQNSGFIFLISQQDSIVALSDPVLPVNHYLLPEYTSGINLFHNGWYYTLSLEMGDYRLWAFMLIKFQYPYQNDFLVNEFYDEYELPDFTFISDDSALDGFHVYNSSNDFAFTLYFKSNSIPVSTHFSFYSLLFLWLFFFTSFFGLFKLYHTHLNEFTTKSKKWISICLLLLLLVVLRAFLFYADIFSFFPGNEFYSSTYYAANIWVPSLGDLWLNILFYTYFSFAFLQFSQNLNNNAGSGYGFPSIQIVARVLLYVVGLSIISYITVNTVYGLVHNSRLQLNVDFIFQFDIYHLIGFISIVLLLISFYFLWRGFSYFLLFHGQFRTIFVKLLLLMGVIAVSVFLVFYKFNFSSFIIILLIVGIVGSISLIYAPSYMHKRNLMVIGLFLLFIIFTLYLFVLNTEKEKLTRQNVAFRVASEQDPIAEYLFTELEEYLIDDINLSQMIISNPFDYTGIESYLRNNYFDDFWMKYDIQITVCAPGEMIVINPTESQMLCEEFFEYYIDSSGRPTPSNLFYYLDNNSGRNSYLAVLPIFRINSAEMVYTLYVEFESRFIPKELGFPELLIDKNIDIARNLGDYSYAIYKDGRLINKFGQNIYSVNINDYLTSFEETFNWFERDGYSHLVYVRDRETYIVVSKKMPGFIQVVAPFSYLTIITISLVLVWYFLNLLFTGKWNLTFQFKRRIQFVILGILLISLVSIGGTSAWFLINIYENKNQSVINEKAHGILIEMEKTFLEVDLLDFRYQESLTTVLWNLSHVFFTDINVFDVNGNLLASSRGKVFEEGLISPIMNHVAYRKMSTEGQSLFTHKESIGKLEYYSAYVPVRNREGLLIGYINLPYFAQESEFRSEISYFLLAFLNIYLILILLSSAIAIITSNYVTKPLQIIKDSISRLGFGRSNERIEWSRRDEIGQLVAEYNRMIEELSISADLLAKSERESAWREMAKQVAHEIKNPLTPMRLNVQYLQRAWKDKAPDWDERLERFSHTMVEQIDNLSVIANEFSDFAKMPSSKTERVDIKSFLKDIPELYKGFENTLVECLDELPTNKTYLVADANQLIRVFNNLIKNALQAYPKGEMARVEIKVRDEKEYCLITVQDWGSGISSDAREKIFQPYFTTKSGGTGLGLAMVKNIVESFNGHITFSSSPEAGTTFYVRLPFERPRA